MLSSPMPRYVLLMHCPVHYDLHIFSILLFDEILDIMKSFPSSPVSYLIINISLRWAHRQTMSSRAKAKNHLAASARYLLFIYSCNFILFHCLSLFRLLLLLVDPNPLVSATQISSRTLAAASSASSLLSPRTRPLRPRKSSNTIL